MKQVLINVLLNSLQALAERENPRLRITAELFEERVVLQVTDNGPGISPEVRQKAFEPFFTTKAGGTGLGLFVSYQLARRNSVEIQLDGAPDGGAMIRLIFSKTMEVLD